jgi:DNA-binding CsgD family transcriptional regulator
MAAPDARRLRLLRPDAGPDGLAAEPGVRSGPLVGRAVERARIAELVREARSGRGGALVVRGEPGIGKTALALDAADRAQACRVVVVRCVEPELELACSGVGELVRALADSVEPLPGSTAAVLRAVLGLADQPPVTSSYAICIAVHSLITLAADRRPLVVVVDDAHWLDPTSRDVLCYVGRRLSERRVLLLMTTRTHEPSAAELLTAIPVMDLERLPQAESRVLLQAMTAEIGVDPRVAAELAVLADGNPLALRELVSGLSATQLIGRSPLPDPRRGGLALLGLMAGRIARLTPAARQALLIAALCVDSDLATIGRTVTAARGTADDLEHAAAAGLVRFDGTRVEFSHPLLRCGVVEAAAPTAKAAALEALAATAPPDVQVLYRAAGAHTPDDTIADGLRRAAGRARRAGDHLTAARTLWRASELSEPGPGRAACMLDAAADAHVAGRLDLAEAWARAAYTAHDGPVLRADARAGCARAAMWSGRLDDARAVFADAVPHVEHLDPVRATAMLLDRALLEAMSARPAEAARVAAHAARLLNVDEMRARGLPWLVVPYVMVLDGDVARGLDILDRGAVDLAGQDDLPGLPIRCFAAQAYTWGERFDQAGMLLDRILGTARAAAAPIASTTALAHRSEVGCWTGSWTLAAADAAESVRLAREFGQAGAEAFALTRLAWIQANRGDPAAQATAAAAVAAASPGGADGISADADAIRGRYELGRSDLTAAGQWLDRAAARGVAVAPGNPMTTPWVADHIEVLARTNRRDEASDRLAELDRQAARSGLIWPAAVAARCRALLAAGDAADEHFAEAIHHHDRIDAAFDRARTQLCWGNSLLRRRRRQPARAREHLTAALDTFERLRATSWIEQTRAALTVAGAPTPGGDVSRTRGLDDLTAQELQVSLAVVKGLSNPEAAAALFLSRKSVERHLSTVYRKLGIRSRTELVAYVSRVGTDPTDRPPYTAPGRRPERPGGARSA